MLWKHLLMEPPRASGPQFGAKEMAAIATVWVTSEGADAPIDRAFDQSRGAGGSRRVASLPGKQQLILAFDTLQTIRTTSLEVEELEVSRAQVLHVSVSYEGGQTYQGLRRQGYTFSPPGRH